MRVLVAFGSKHGATAEIAEAIADELRAAGLAVDCMPAHDVGDLGDYAAAIVGSAVYMKRWRRPARRLLRRHADKLAGMPLWIFSSGPVGADADFSSSWCEPPGVVALAERLGARDHVVFGGRVPIEGGGPAGAAMRRDTPLELRDLRDWNVIRGWAAGVADALRASAGDVVTTP